MCVCVFVFVLCVCARVLYVCLSVCACAGGAVRERGSREKGARSQDSVKSSTQVLVRNVNRRELEPGVAYRLSALRQDQTGSHSPSVGETIVHYVGSAACYNPDVILCG